MTLPTAETTPSTQTIRTERTRAALLSAAEKIFARDGFEAARIEEIAAEAGRTRGAFYANFESKTDVFLALRSALVRRRAREIRERISGLSDGDTRVEAIRRFIVEHVCDPRELLLQIEFKLFALHHPQKLADLAEKHLDTSSSIHEEELSEVFPIGSRAFNDMRRDTLAIESILEGFGLNFLFNPEVLTQEYLEETIPVLLAHLLPHGI